MFIAESVTEKKLKSVNIIFGKVTTNTSCALLRLANTLLKDEESVDILLFRTYSVN